MASLVKDRIPKIIHQLWIGPKPPPTKFMDTWRDKNPEFQYIRWNEDELIKRNMKLQCVEKINDIEEINGKADIIRWEILYEYGGIFVDADSICIEPVDDHLMSKKAFMGFENEKVRNAGWAPKQAGYDDVLASTHPLIATGTMAFPPKHELPKLAIQEILQNEVSIRKTTRKAWRTVGPGLLTRLYFSKKWKDITVFPSYYFLPEHVSGQKYEGHGKIYAYQEWGSTKNSYDTMNNIKLPDVYNKPEKNVSVLISSYDTKAVYIKECLESIKHQIGHFNMEIIWINDGSNTLNTAVLKKMLDNFENTTRFTTVIYEENDGNKGIGFTLNKGILMCNNEIIIKMDSDDIMVPGRIKFQLNFMENNSNIHICGSQINMFNDKYQMVRKTNLPTITWEKFKKNPQHWFVNHPTICYRKSSVIKAGNYDKSLKRMAEDFNLELRMLQKFGMIFNFPEALLNYRLHENQVTKTSIVKEGNDYWTNIRNKMIHDLIEKDKLENQ